jgi:hypothetical protein
MSDRKLSPVVKRSGNQADGTKPVMHLYERGRVLLLPNLPMRT